MSSMQWSASSLGILGVQVAGGDDDVGIHVVTVFEYSTSCFHGVHNLPGIGDVARQRRWPPPRRGWPDRSRCSRGPCGPQSCGWWWRRTAPRPPECPCSRPGTGRRWGWRQCSRRRRRCGCSPAAMHVLYTSWVAGMTMPRTPSATVAALQNAAAASMSSIRPLVQEPMTT